MHPRIDYALKYPKASEPFLRLGKHIARSGLESSLLHLVKLRASQINGCGFCLEMHSQHALHEGEMAHRIILLSAWRETTKVFSEREQAALRWTELLTELESGVPQDEFDLVSTHFSESELVYLTWTIALINGWNRMAIAFGHVAGHHHPS